MIGNATPGGSGFGGGVGRSVDTGGNDPGGTTSPRSTGMKVERRNQSAGLLPPTPPWNRS